MAMYRLWRATDNKTFEDIDANSDGHAVAIFGERFGLNLTLKDDGSVAGYMMQQVKGGWTGPPDIPVWEKRKRPN